MALSPPDKPEENEFLYKDIKIRADFLFFNLVNSTPLCNIPKHETLFTLVTLLMYLAESKLLSPEQAKYLDTSLQQINDLLGTEGYNLESLPKKLKEIIKQITEDNSRAKIIIDLVNIEFNLEIANISSKMTPNPKELQKILQSFKNGIKDQNIKEFEIKQLAKELHEIAKLCKKKQLSYEAILEKLKILFSEFFKHRQ